jgi:hypothetical protein
MDGVITIHDTWGHLGPGLRAGSTQLAIWAGTSHSAVAVNANVVGLNMLITDPGFMTGDLPALIYNSIKWLCTTPSIFTSFLPHFAVQENAWGTELALSNFTAIEQGVQLDVFPDNGGMDPVATTNLILQPHGGVFQPVEAFFPVKMDVPIGWIRISSFTEDIKGIMKFTFLPAGGTSSLPTVYETANQIALPLLENTPEWQSGFAVINPQDSTAICSADAFAFDGTHLGAVAFDIPPNGKFVRFLDDNLFSKVALPDQVILVVTSSNRVTGFALTLSSDYSRIVAVPSSGLPDN